MFPVESTLVFCPRERPAPTSEETGGPASEATRLSSSGPSSPCAAPSHPPRPSNPCCVLQTPLKSSWTWSSATCRPRRPQRRVLQSQREEEEEHRAGAGRTEASGMSCPLRAIQSSSWLDTSPPALPLPPSPQSPHGLISLELPTASTTPQPSPVRIPHQDPGLAEGGKDWAPGEGACAAEHRTNLE